MRESVVVGKQMIFLWNIYRTLEKGKTGLADGYLGYVFIVC